MLNLRLYVRVTTQSKLSKETCGITSAPKKHRSQNCPKVNLKQILEFRFKADSVAFLFT
jgi:hypothetical protein